MLSHVAAAARADGKAVTWPTIPGHLVLKPWPASWMLRLGSPSRSTPRMLPTYVPVVAVTVLSAPNPRSNAAFSSNDKCSLMREALASSTVAPKRSQNLVVVPAEAAAAPSAGGG